MLFVDIYGTWVDPRDGVCQELTSEVEEDHDEDKRAGTEDKVALGHAGSALNLIAVFVLAELGVEGGKAFSELGLDAFDAVQAVVSGHPE